MAVMWDVLLYLLAFAIILVILIRMATRARAEAPKEAEGENPRDAMLLRFLNDESGKRLGETVALEGDDFIVKDARGFFAVPAANVKEDGKELRLTGTFDDAAARTKGEAWRTRSHKVITYSDAELPKEDAEA